MKTTTKTKDENYYRALHTECRSAVRYYFSRLLQGEYDDPTTLSDEDVLSASMYGERVYLDSTDWTATQCTDEAYRWATEIKSELVQAFYDGDLPGHLTFTMNKRLKEKLDA